MEASGEAAVVHSEKVIAGRFEVIGCSSLKNTVYSYDIWSVHGEGNTLRKTLEEKTFSRDIQ